MRLYAFTGTRYSVGGSRTGDLVAPPYDQIDLALCQRLHAVPNHFAHLTRPVGLDGAEPHQAAAKLYLEWLQRDVIAADETPSLYPYVIEVRDGGLLSGLCGLIGLEAPDSGIIRPHEKTVDQTVEERLGLLRAMRVDLEPILLLADDAGELDQLLAEDLEGLAPLANHTDARGNHHHLYRLSDRWRISKYQELLLPVNGLIADGHHRYTVALRYASEMAVDNTNPVGTKLAVVTSLSSTGLQIDPIHRGLGLSVAPAVGASLLRQRQRLPASSGSELAATVAAAPQPSLAVALRGEAPELWSFDPSVAPAEMASGMRNLAVGWLHWVVLPSLGLTASAATDGTVAYYSDAGELLSELEAGRLRVGFWLPPVSAEDFGRTVAEGDLLPPKSTRFLPKVSSGLVWAEHHCQLA